MDRATLITQVVRARSLPRRLRAGLRRNRWATRVFAGCDLGAGGRLRLVARLGPSVLELESEVRRWRAGQATAEAPATALVTVCEHADDGSLWHPDLGWRAYTDASFQALVCRRFLTEIANGDERATAEAFAAALPGRRPLLLALGELRLDDGDLDGAIDAARAALRVQSICPAGESLLLRAYRAKREAGDDDPAFALADIETEGRFCSAPFDFLSTGVDGHAFACSCPAWVPFPVGNVYEAEGPEDVWNSATVQEIRRSILDGDFRYCSRTQCSLLLADKLPRTEDVVDPDLRRYIDEHVTRLDAPPKVIELNHDPTCNLACPSCRTEVVATPKSERGRLQRAADDVLLPLMRRSDGFAYISGGGEALSSPHFRSILRKLNREEFPGLQVYLITNGQLLTPRRWATMPNLEAMLYMVSVSVDAARPETYERLRRPGRWEVLRRNLDFIGGLYREGRFPNFCMNFVVQHDNFREMLEFADLADEVGANRLWYQRLVNYGSYAPDEFARLDVASPRHPDHAELLAMLRHPRLRRPEVNLNMLLGLLPEYVESDEEMLLRL